MYYKSIKFHRKLPKCLLVFCVNGSRSLWHVYTLEWPIFFLVQSFWRCSSRWILSPVLFAVYMDPLILKLRKLTVGCKIDDHFYGCLLYADDIMLLMHSVNAMRRMLSVCEEFAADLDIKFSV